MAVFTGDEAIWDVIMAQDKVLSNKIEQHTSHIASIKAQIKLVGEGIRELMNIFNQL